MIVRPKVYTIELPGHSRHSALVRESDYSVVFGPKSWLKQSQTDMQHQFSAIEDSISKQQPCQSSRPRPAELTVYLVISEQCNLRCEYCDVLGSIADHSRLQNMTQEIASKSLNLLYERMRADENLRAKVVFFGGEPLMNWPLLEWACKDIAAQDFVGRISKMLITNGTLLTRDLAMLLRQHDVYVVVSLDGRPAINDSVRQAPDGSGSYGAVSVGIDCLQETMPGRFGISCTVGRHNATSLPEEIAYLQEQFQPRSIGLNIYHYQNDGTSPIEENASTMCKALLDVFRMARSEGIVIYQFLSILRSFVRRERNRDYCAACADKLVVTPRGTVGRCEALMFNERYCVSLDEYREDPNPSALDWSSFTPRVENDCQECASRWICPGGCVYDSIVRSGIVRGTEQRRCMFMKMMLQELLSILLSEVLKTEPEREIVIPTKHHFERLLGQMEISLLDAY